MENAANKPISLTLVAGSTYAQREIWICNHLPQHVNSAVLLEGMPSGEQHLNIKAKPQVMLERVASGCFCCAGNLVLKVVLNRLIRQHPHAIFIAISQVDHLANLRNFLASETYLSVLQLQENQILPC